MRECEIDREERRKKEEEEERGKITEVSQTDQPTIQACAQLPLFFVLW